MRMGDLKLYTKQSGKGIEFFMQKKLEGMQRHRWQKQIERVAAGVLYIGVNNTALANVTNGMNVVVVYHVTIVAIGRGLLKKCWPMV